MTSPKNRRFSIRPNTRRVRGASARTSTSRILDTDTPKQQKESKPKASARLESVPAKPAAILIKRLPLHRDEWLDDCKISLHNKRTIKQRPDDTNRLIGYLVDNGFDVCGDVEMKRFFATPKNLKMGEPLAFDTVVTFWRNFTAFRNGMKRQGIATESPMDVIPPIPSNKQKVNQQVQPFSPEQWRAILAAVQKSAFPPP